MSFSPSPQAMRFSGFSPIASSSFATPSPFEAPGGRTCTDSTIGRSGGALLRCRAGSLPSTRSEQLSTAEVAPAVVGYAHS